MIKSVLEAAGKKVGMIGTNGIYFMGRHQETYIIIERNLI